MAPYDLSPRSSLILVSAATLSLLCLPAFARGQVTDLRSLDLPRWELGPEEAKLGSIDGENDAFVQIAQVRTDDEAQVYVLDVRLPALRVFDRTGRFIRQIGTAGDGPGEYRNPGPFGFLGDTIWIAEGRSGRMSLFESDGTLLATISLTSGRERLAPIGLLDADEFLVLTPSGLPDLSQVEVGKVFFEQSIIRRNQDGTIRDTVATYMTEPGLLMTGGGSMMMVYEPFRAVPIVSYRPESDEIIEVDRPIAEAADSAAFRITVRTRDGRVLRERLFVYRPLPISEAVRDTVRADTRRTLEGSSRANELEELVQEHLDIPRFMPPVSAVHRAPDGTMWIRRESHSGIADGTYLILDADLNPRATFALPEDTRLMTITGSDHVWVVTRDEFDVQYLVRYRLQRM